MEKKLKTWQGWLLFGAAMTIVFVLGLCVSSLMERRAEVASIFNNRKTPLKGYKVEMTFSRAISLANTKRGKLRQIPLSRANFIAVRQ